MGAAKRIPVRVLVVDDDPTIGDLLKSALESDEDTNYTADVVRGGEEGLACIEAGMQAVPPRIPRIILLDWMMPGVDGPTFAKRLHDLLQSHVPPIIMITAIGDAHKHAMEIDAEYYLEKPFDLQELYSIMRLTLARYYATVSLADSAS